MVPEVLVNIADEMRLRIVWSLICVFRICVEWPGLAHRCCYPVQSLHAVTSVSVMRHVEFQTVKATWRLPPPLEASSPELEIVGSISFLFATKFQILRSLPCSSFFNKGTLHPEFVNVFVSAGVTDLRCLVEGEKNAKNDVFDVY